MMEKVDLLNLLKVDQNFVIIAVVEIILVPSFVFLIVAILRHTHYSKLLF